MAVRRGSLENIVVIGFYTEHGKCKAQQGNKSYTCLQAVGVHAELIIDRTPGACQSP